MNCRSFEHGVIDAKITKRTYHHQPERIESMSFAGRIFKPTDLTKLPLNGWPNYFKDLPAIPIKMSDMADLLVISLKRKAGLKPVKLAATGEYTINDRTGVGYDFLFAHEEDLSKRKVNHALFYIVAMKQLTQEFLGKLGEDKIPFDLNGLESLSLDDPEQWTIGWTTFAEINERGEAMRSTWVSTLTDANEATRLFWPTIAQNGTPYNLLILQKVGYAQFGSLKKVFQSVWQTEWDALYDAGRLYVMDLSIFKNIEPQKALGFDRFTPSTITLLKQDAESKAIIPLAVEVSGHEGKDAQTYSRERATDSAWLYALQAAKTSVTVYGIWLGHVYQWHLVTGAMQMTMYQSFSEDHAIYQLLAPQSKYLITFNSLLLTIWRVLAPPTSINSSNEFLQLCNHFAKGRQFFDDDPLTTLDRLRLEKSNFTKDEAWDLYPIVQTYLKIWRATESYVNTFVEVTYPDDQAIINDKALQKWINASKTKGNIRGLPTMNSKEALKQVLTSLLYRITMHGASRLDSRSTPALTFVSNFPTCLQRTDIPSPNQELDTNTLLQYMPKTGTIGSTLNFYFVFIFGKPNESFIPSGGVESDLFFEDPDDERNLALITYREKVIEVINSLQDNPTIYRWPKGIEI